MSCVFGFIKLFLSGVIGGFISLYLNQYLKKENIQVGRELSVFDNNGMLNHCLEISNKSLFGIPRDAIFNLESNLRLRPNYKTAKQGIVEYPLTWIEETDRSFITFNRKIDLFSDRKVYLILFMSNKDGSNLELYHEDHGRKGHKIEVGQVYQFRVIDNKGVSKTISFTIKSLNPLEIKFQYHPLFRKSPKLMGS